MKSIVCDTEIEQPEVSPFAAYGGLPSPCCTTCFEVNDFRIKDLTELKLKSLLRRHQNGVTLARD